MIFHEYIDSELLAMGLANRIAGQLNMALKQQDRALLVVPGGTTPGPVFDDLCAADLDWDRVDVLLSDERWRPEVHVRSNTRLIRERLLTGRAAAARFLPLYARTDTPDEALADLTAAIEPCLPVTVALLGMGTDMHIASIFPKGDNLEQALAFDAPVLVAMRVPDEPEPRITLSARILNDAMSKHIVIIGQAKRAALERARALPSNVAPVAAVLDDTEVHWALE